jgi:hypothetical protein
LILHKRGIVDGEFVRQVAGISNLPSFTVGDQFALTGYICTDLAGACRRSAAWLVNAVHAWIIGHAKND